MAISFDRPGSVPAPDLAEPYRTLLTFLSDLDEQVELELQRIGENAEARALLDTLRQNIAVLGIACLAAGQCTDSNCGPDGEPGAQA